MISNSYNSHETRARVITSENTFANGMRHTTNPLTEGYVRTLINFTLDNDGATIKPRFGYTQIQKAIGTYTIDEATQDFCVYLTENLLIETADQSDAILCKVMLSGAIDVADTVAQSMGYPLQLFNTASSNIVVLYKGKYIEGINNVYDKFTAKGTDDKYYLAMQACGTKIHDVDIGVTHSRNGIHTVMDSVAYVPLIHTYKDSKDKLIIERCICLMRLQFTEDGGVAWWLDELSPKDITAVQAVNYGYNMLHKTPYNFVNQPTSNGIILADGILPYSNAGKLLTSARAGEEIYFHLVYRYPNTDVTSGKKYKVRWAVQDLDSDTAEVELQSYTASPTYTPGDDIFIRTTQTTYKRFTLIANVCYADEVTTDTPEPKALATMTIAYYYLTNDSGASTLNLNANTYDLGTAQGMCTWQQRLVLWGVTNAKNTLWVSEVNDPSWFPYPNNCEIFPDDIVACVRYKTSLLVFTQSALYKLDFQSDGLTYTTTCMQERLSLDANDVGSIIPVQNMVFFKNGNAYYMIVPVSTSTTGELQLAPITRPIESLFNDFKVQITNLLETVVQPTSYQYYIYNEDGVYITDEQDNMLYVKLLEDETISFHLYDWWCLLENKTIRVYYKFLMNTGENKAYLDLVFNYDTYTRAWTMSLWNSTRYRMTHYMSSVTTETVFAKPALSAEHTVTVNLLQGTEDSLVDSFDTDYDCAGWAETVQYMDTGYRELGADLKKRFRQVQFRVNNVYSDTLKFYSAFYVDNDMRKAYCTFDTTEITDPEAEDYGTVYIDSILEDPEVVDGYTERNEFCNAWDLDISRFPNMHTAQVKLNVSGKGRLCRLELRSYNTSAFEISSMAWVYKPMYAR